jgi:ketosteroid isomerase-like protein
MRSFRGYAHTATLVACLAVLAGCKYVVVWKKQTHGQWKAAVDIFNTDQ